MAGQKRASREGLSGDDKGTKRKASATVSKDAKPNGQQAQPADVTDPASLIDGRVSAAQIGKACSALIAHRNRQKSSDDADQLPLEGESDDEEDGAGARSAPSDIVWMQITVKTLNENAPAKPIRIATPHPIYPKTSSICLLCADPQRTYKDLMVAQKCTQVKRVVGVSKLKGKFAPFEARRQLASEHDLFLADDRIIPMLPKLLGKKWMSERKTPIPIQLTKTSEGRIPKQIQSTLSSTVFHRNKGTCASVRLGTIRHLTADELMENAKASLPVIVKKHIKGGWENVQSVDIKTGTSASLPVWNCKVSDRWTGMPEKEDEAKVVETSEKETEDDGADAPVSKKPKVAAKPSKPTSTKSKSGSPVRKAKKASSTA